MGKFGDADWRGFVKLFSLWFLCAALIYLGAQTLMLNNDLKKTRCLAAYYQAMTLGHPSSYCPPGCECSPWMFR
jgi:hypothetical protein